MTESACPDGIDFFVGSERRRSQQPLEVRCPYDSRRVGSTWRATEAHVDEAVALAERHAPAMARLSGGERAAILSTASERLWEERELFARTISEEAGKPLRDARGEVGRAVLVFQTAAEEATRIGGEWMPLDVLEATRGQWALVRRFPLGPIAAITPFNFPLNLVAHKLAPAIAAGNTVVLKPSSSTPLTALRLASLLYGCGLPEHALSVLPCTPLIGEHLVGDPRLRMLTFTGSPPVGWRLKSMAGRKRVTLELGGNAGVIVHHDANLSYAARRCAVGGFTSAGQSCISVQRIYVHERIREAFESEFLEHVRALKVGDPADETTDVGPLINEASASRALEWIREALSGGARLLTGGERHGSCLQPTVLTDTTPVMKVNCQEVFAPLVTIIPYHDVDVALRQLDDSEYGLQAGLFTHDLGLVFRAYEQLSVGGLVVNDVSAHRVDPMPYGGVKGSGLGREGVRWAIGEMTEEKLMLYNPAGL